MEAPESQILATNRHRAGDLLEGHEISSKVFRAEGRRRCTPDLRTTASLVLKAVCTSISYEGAARLRSSEAFYRNTILEESFSFLSILPMELLWFPPGNAGLTL